MKFSRHLLSSVLVCVICPYAEATLRTAAELTRYADREVSASETYAITATVTHVDGSITVYVEDETGGARLTKTVNGHLQAGDVIRAAGTIAFDPYANAATSSNDTVTVIGHVTPPPPLAVGLSDIDARNLAFRRVVTEGEVLDARHDEIDARYVFLTLRDGTAKLPIIFPEPKDFDARDYLGARIRVEGIFLRRAIGYRIFSGPFVQSDTTPEILTPPPKDPFSAPELVFFPLLTPQEIRDMPRRSVVGRVLGVWDGNRFLLRSANGRMIRVETLEDVPLPGYGDSVKVVGNPATDHFHINLTQALVRPEPDEKPFCPEPAQSVDLSRFAAADGIPTDERFFNLYGHAIRFVGLVRRTPGDGNPATTLRVLCGHVTATVRAGTSGLDLSAVRDGCELDLSGLYLFECENWSPGRSPTGTMAITLVLRTADDLVVLRQPPWWTPARLLTAIAILLAGLLGIALWNRHLNRLVNRRGQELAREKLRKETAQLKTRERTHLAVELHDSLSQTLEGIACQLATSRLLTRESDPTKPFLETAERMLDSCRLELRRCLFDLRGNALEQKDFTSALRATLEPICAGVELSVRFDVRRARFDDQTVHAVLCIVRELVANAIRHGKATGIRVAGECHDDALSFSVRDNGCGFDPENRPGASTGHFGLLGVQERVNRFDGTLSISSTPGRGTRVSARLAVKPIARTANK